MTKASKSLRHNRCGALAARASPSVTWMAVSVTVSVTDSVTGRVSESLSQ